MKKYGILFLIIVLGLAGCKKQDDVARISGEIKGLGNDTLYLYGTDQFYDRIDTIYVQDDKFTHTVQPDTLISALLLLKNNTEYPLFLEKGNKIKIEGTADNLDFLKINGNTPNKEFTAFQQELQGLGKPSPKVMEEKAEEFIRQHHSSLVSIYLLDKHFVQKESPDFTKIKALIEMMTGVLQDRPYIENLDESIKQAEKAMDGKYAPFFSLPNAKGEKLSRSSEPFKKKYLLVNFWASWCDSCRTQNAELRDLYRTYKKSKDFAILGISLDLDKKEWQEAIRRDTLQWEQVCDFSGFNSETVKQYNITALPTTFLLSPEGKILARGLRGEALKTKLKEVLPTYHSSTLNKK